MGAFSSGFEKSASAASKGGSYLERAMAETHSQLLPWKGTSGMGRALGYASYIPDVYQGSKEIGKITDSEDLAAVKVRKLKKVYGDMLTKQKAKDLRRRLSQEYKHEGGEGLAGIGGGIGLGALGAGLLAAPFTGGASMIPSVAAMIAGGMVGGLAGDKLGRKGYRIITERDG